MPRLVWLTDIHLNFVSPAQAGELFLSVAAGEADAVVITGDIAEAPSFRGMLLRMAEIVRKPIYFVLGNHDFYFGSIERTRGEARMACRQSGYLHWLNDADVVELGPNTALVGHDGWGDGRLGDYSNSRVRLSDFDLIADLAGLSPASRSKKLGELGDEAGSHLARVLATAVERYKEVIVATHVPPFREAAWHRGRLSDAQWLPYFACKAAGDAIARAFEGRPECAGLVLCGHTHSPGEADILANLHVATGGSEYGRPALQRILDVGD
jgi:3',5'-cyclic AMP phosphodiesterase CpdA